MHLWCSKGIAPQAQAHERETCLSSFQHSLKRVFVLCRCFQTASHQCNPQQLMGQVALALGQWGTRASRMGCGLVGRLLVGLTAPHQILAVFDTIPEGSESDIFMLPVDDASRVQGASRHQSKAFGGPQPRVEDRESPMHVVGGIVAVQHQKLGSETGTNCRVDEAP